MRFVGVELVCGSVLLVLVGVLAVLRATRSSGVRRIPAPVLFGGASTATLFTGHALVVLAVQRGDGPAWLDGPTLAWFLADRSDTATLFMRAASLAGDSPLTVLFVTLAVALLWWRSHRATAVVTAVAALGSPLLSSGFKLLYRRVRPPVADHLTAAGGFALPSGHAVNSLVVGGVFVAAGLLHLRRTWPRFGLVCAGAVGVVAVGVSRLYLGVHWLTDVLAGWLLGGAWLAVCVAAMIALQASATPVGDGPEAERIDHCSEVR